MNMTDIELDLTDQERQIRDTAHRFAEEVMRPAGRELDKLADPADVIKKESILWEVFRKHREIGLADLETETASLPPRERSRLRALISEEMGWGDSGLAISLGVANFHKTFAMMSGKPALIERWCQPGAQDVGCWAVTEPDHGSDSLTVTEKHFSDPSLKANCIARKDGDFYIINGQKSAWVSNGTIATVAALFCTIDGDQGFKGGGVAVVDLTLPGVSKGKPLNKLGQRALNQGEMFFDNVRIPAENMVIGKELYAPVVENILTMANASMGTIFIGVARAAYEMAVDYAKQRVQGGVPIIEHQGVKSRLFKMFMQVEAARSLARRVYVYNTTNPGLIQYSIASKVFCTNTAFQVASDALQIFGGNGLTKEFMIEKLMRDARASMIEDGCNEILGLVAAARL
ncbi:MAG: acyl-CoA/acyl-ACP dehydrogenase [Dehalococcoidia bacterium]|nr:MAG: acyl-CoA dehydrogenase [bacterium]MCE7928641.1 acyl-CoA dehydrogenase [Chloroflexi bacterium CFX7]MCL4230761.1 acyl-CoA/acyl-ACP dehydrogenase [Dehalococcoidia bacterium]NUQ54989.1 acyl-CoA/acyl-ACP dehydrogenase [Dehalococcoidia bacterium]RIL04066.1 MAG: acyl-CoA dehydrogenase [bacterium]